MSTLIDRVSETIDKFVAENSAFRDACDRCFCQADKDDDAKLSPAEVVSVVNAIFQDLEDVLKAAGIKVEKPTQSKIQFLLESADLDGNEVLDEDEFFMFYRQVLKLAAFNSARGFIANYGASVTAALTSAVAIHTGKQKIEIPEELKPLIPYATPLISIAVGVLARYGITIKKKSEAEKKLFRCETFKKPLD